MMSSGERLPLLRPRRSITSSSPLILAIAGVALLGICFCATSIWHSQQTELLVKVRSANNQAAVQKQLDLARQLWATGSFMEFRGEHELAEARALAMSILAEANSTVNGTNSTGPTAEEIAAANELLTLQDRGVNVDNWPFADILDKPKHAYNDSEKPDEPEKKRDVDNRDKLEKGGINVGRWFWDDKDFGEDAKEEPAADNATEAANATTPAEAAGEGAANATNATNATSTTEGEEESEDVPANKLKKLGINVDGSPWDEPQKSKGKKLQGKGDLEQLRNVVFTNRQTRLHAVKVPNFPLRH